MNRDLLSAPFPSSLVQQRPGHHGKTLRYVPTHAVIMRLNEGCGSWSFEIVRYEILDDAVIVVGKLTADGVVKMAFGTSGITRGRDGDVLAIGDDAKSAASYALKKGATLLGVGLYLHGPSSTGPERALPSPRLVMTNVHNSGDHATERQVDAVQNIARRRNIDPRRLSSMLEERFNKREPIALTKGEASAVLSELSEMPPLGFVGPRAKP